MRLQHTRGWENSLIDQAQLLLIPAGVSDEGAAPRCRVTVEVLLSGAVPPFEVSGATVPLVLMPQQVARGGEQRA